MTFQENIHQILAELDGPATKLDCLLPLISPEHFEAYYSAMTALEREMVEALYNASLRFRAEIS